MAYQTTLPKQQIGSLGTEKTDRTTVINPYKDVVASEVNLSNKCLEELFERIGLYDGSTTGSIEERYHPAMFTYEQPFIGTPGRIVGLEEWHNGGLAAPTYAGDVGAGVLFSSDADQLIAQVPILSSSMTIYHSQYAKISCEMDMNPIVSFYNDDTSYDYGVVATGSNIIGSTGSLCGYITDDSGTTYTSLGSYTFDTEFCLETLLLSKKFYCSLNRNRGERVYCGEVPEQKYYIFFESHNTAEAADNWKLKLLKIRALFNE